MSEAITLDSIIAEAKSKGWRIPPGMSPEEFVREYSWAAVAQYRGNTEQFNSHRAALGGDGINKSVFDRAETDTTNRNISRTAAMNGTTDPLAANAPTVAGADAPKPNTNTDGSSLFTGMDGPDGNAWDITAVTRIDPVTGEVVEVAYPGSLKGAEYYDWTTLNANERMQLKIDLYYGGFYDDPTAAYRFLGDSNITPADTKALAAAQGIANMNGYDPKDTIEAYSLAGRQTGGPLNVTPDKPTVTEAEIVANGISFQDSMREYAYANGIKLSNDFITKNYQKVLDGETTEVEVLNHIRDKYILGAYPAWKEEIKAGMNIADLAAPYVNSMAQLYDVPADSINLNDPAIRQAMMGVGGDGKPVYTPLWQFEQKLKTNDKFKNSTDGQNEFAEVGTDLLRDFGFIG